MARRLVLTGGPADGKEIVTQGVAWVWVPVSPAVGVTDIAVYDAFTGEYNHTKPGRERDYPKCPNCGGRTMRAPMGDCDHDDCDIVMCAEGLKDKCVIAMHSKQDG